MQGLRIYPREDGRLYLQEGDYGLDLNDGYWYGRPHGHHAGSFKLHDVTEHEDGTITVSPSFANFIASAGGIGRPCKPLNPNVLTQYGNLLEQPIPDTKTTSHGLRFNSTIAFFNAAMCCWSARFTLLLLLLID